MEEYRGKYRKTSSNASYVSSKKNSGSKGFFAGLFKQTIWSAIILAVSVMISSSSSPIAQSTAQYIKSAICYKPDIDWAVESISTFFEKNEETEDGGADEAVPVSSEDKNEEVPK